MAGLDKIKEQQAPQKTTKESLLNTPDSSGISIEVTEKGQFRIIHESGMRLPFVLQGLKEALEMRKKIEKVMIIQETCVQKKSLLDTCKIYSEKSFDNYTADLFIDNNQYFIGPDSLILPSEEIEATIRGVNKKHSIKSGGISPFAEGMATFLNTIQDSKIKLTKR